MTSYDQLLHGSNHTVHALFSEGEHITHAQYVQLSAYIHTHTRTRRCEGYEKRVQTVHTVHGIRVGVVSQGCRQ